MLTKEILKYTSMMALLSKQWFMKLLKGVLVYYSAAIVLSSIQLSGSLSQEELTTNATNDTIVDPSCISPENPNCSELPAVCVDCDFFDEDGLPECNYNENTTFSCRPLAEAVCKVCFCIHHIGDHFHILPLLDHSSTSKHSL